MPMKRRHPQSEAMANAVAREAAILYSTGEAESLNEAIAAAWERSARGQVHSERTPRPTLLQVREHLRGMSMQALGALGYRARIEDFWRCAERIMTALEAWSPVLLGRGAEGNIDGGATIRIRIFTPRTCTIGGVAETLVSAGFGEPEFTTLASRRFGRFDQVEFESEEGPVVVTRCPETHTHRRELRQGVNLVTGGRLAMRTLAEIRRLIDDQGTSTRKLG